MTNDMKKVNRNFVSQSFGKEKTLHRLAKLAREVETFKDFKAEVIRWPRAFGIALFTEKDYETFYRGVKQPWIN